MKRPLLTVEARRELRTAVTRAERHVSDSPNQAYARGVIDTLRWLDGADESPMLREVTR